jgi:hypothetical protein
MHKKRGGDVIVCICFRVIDGAMDSIPRKAMWHLPVAFCGVCYFDANVMSFLRFPCSFVISMSGQNCASSGFRTLRAMSGIPYLGVLDTA